MVKLTVDYDDEAKVWVVKTRTGQPGYRYSRRSINRSDPWHFIERTIVHEVP